MPLLERPDTLFRRFQPSTDENTSSIDRKLLIVRGFLSMEDSLATMPPSQEPRWDCFKNKKITAIHWIVEKKHLIGMSWLK